MTGNPSRVLIVEDEYYLGKMLEKALIHEEIEAIAVTDVDNAIKEIGKQSFDLIVSDIYMPGRNGKDLFEYVKDQDVEIPFIFMTGNPDLKMAIDFLTSGGYDYIVKPFMIADFIQKVKPVIQNHKIKKQEKNLVKDLRALLSRRLSELKIYQDVFDSTDDGEIITDVDGVIVKVNRGFEKITGFCNEELLQQSIDLLQKSILPDLKFKEILKKLKKENTWHGELKGKKKNNESWVVNITIIFGMARLAEHRDNDTGFHLERIRNYCKLLAEALVEHEMYPDIIDSDFIQMLYRTAPLHDIGKVGIPDYILLKSDTLTEYEFDIMKSHTLIGFNTLNSILKIYGDLPFLQMGIEIAYCHHERWDGSGYPQGLKKDAIPLSAQILSIVDVYDALTTERTYKKAYAHSAALASIKKERGKHFSPKILDIFVEIADDINKIRESFTEMDDIIIPPQIQTEIKNILYKT